VTIVKTMLHTYRRITDTLGLQVENLSNALDKALGSIDEVKTALLNVKKAVQPEDDGMLGATLRSMASATKILPSFMQPVMAQEASKYAESAFNLNLQGAIYYLGKAQPRLSRLLRQSGLLDVGLEGSYFSPLTYIWAFGSALLGLANFFVSTEFLICYWYALCGLSMLYTFLAPFFEPLNSPTSMMRPVARALVNTTDRIGSYLLGAIRRSATRQPLKETEDYKMAASVVRDARTQIPAYISTEEQVKRWQEEYHRRGTTLSWRQYGIMVELLLRENADITTGDLVLNWLEVNLGDMTLNRFLLKAIGLYALALQYTGVLEKMSEILVWLTNVVLWGKVAGEYGGEDQGPLVTLMRGGAVYFAVALVMALSKVRAQNWRYVSETRSLREFLTAPITALTRLPVEMTSSRNIILLHGLHFALTWNGALGNLQFQGDWRRYFYPQSGEAERAYNHTRSILEEPLKRMHENVGAFTRAANSNETMAVWSTMSLLANGGKAGIRSLELLLQQLGGYFSGQ
jgi:hypothetical protein